MKLHLGYRVLERLEVIRVRPVPLYPGDSNFTFYHNDTISFGRLTLRFAATRQWHAVDVPRFVVPVLISREAESDNQGTAQGVFLSKSGQMVHRENKSGTTIQQRNIIQPSAAGGPVSGPSIWSEDW